MDTQTATQEDSANPVVNEQALQAQQQPKLSAHSCGNCGAHMLIPNGTCTVCLACGATTGCS